MSSGKRDFHLGVALAILGGLFLLVKLFTWAGVQALLRLWPVALIVIGWQMYRRAPDRPA